MSAMRVRRRNVCQNVGCILGIFVLFYIAWYIIDYVDHIHTDQHHRRKHLYLTVSKDRIASRFGKLAPKWILMWTKVFGKNKNEDFSDCKGYSDRCILTSDKSFVSKVDAVVFHARDIPETPLPLPGSRRSHQRYVFMTMETPPNSGRQAVPYVVFKYGPYYLPAKIAEEKGFKFTNLYADGSVAKKRSGIFGMISNCNTLSKRELALKELSRYINVTIGGKCALDSSTLDICPRDSDCLDLYSQYPFYFAVENSVCKDYVTEKYWDRISTPSIPIVMRRKVYETSTIPPHSFIAMDDYISPKDMAKHLISLESNKNAYAEYFAWRKGQWTIAPWNAPGYRNGFCRLCERLWEENQESKVIEDVWKWFDEESQCESDEFVQNWIKG